MKRILCSLLVATLPFGSVLADVPKEKKAKVTLVYQHELPNVPGKSIKGVLVEPTALGTGAHQTGRQECAETSTRSFGTKDGGAHAPTLGDGRGLRAVGLWGEEINGGLTNATAQIRESEVMCESSATERETTNRPARGTARSCSGTQARNVEWQPSGGSDPNVHRAANAAQPECGWKHGGAGSRTVLGQRQCHY